MINDVYVYSICMTINSMNYTIMLLLTVIAAAIANMANQSKVAKMLLEGWLSSGDAYETAANTSNHYHNIEK